MANLKKRLSDNAPGTFYVDSTCIDCETCNRFAPANFRMAQGHAFVSDQPQNPQEELMSMQALLSCPVNAIGMEVGKVSSAALDSLPLKLEGPVSINGFNSEDSFAADSYFISDPQGNWLIDSPRFNPVLVKKFKAMGGIKYIFLSHQDDVGDCDRYAEEFGAQRIIHEADSAAVPAAEIFIHGQEEQKIGKARLIPTPGHSRGSMCLLWEERFLFTGDHLPWSNEAGAIRPFRNFCRSWSEQISSVALLEKFSKVQWILPGHGDRVRLPLGHFPQHIREAVAWMQTQ